MNEANLESWTQIYCFFLLVRFPNFKRSHPVRLVLFIFHFHQTVFVFPFPFTPYNRARMFRGDERGKLITHFCEVSAALLKIITGNQRGVDEPHEGDAVAFHGGRSCVIPSTIFGPVDDKQLLIGGSFTICSDNIKSRTKAWC
jgi:hypothetical protein